MPLPQGRVALRSLTAERMRQERLRSTVLDNDSILLAHAGASRVALGSRYLLTATRHVPPQRRDERRRMLVGLHGLHVFDVLRHFLESHGTVRSPISRAAASSSPSLASRKTAIIAICAGRAAVAPGVDSVQQLGMEVARWLP